MLAAPAMAADTVINVSSWLPPQHTLLVNTLKPWTEEVEKAHRRPGQLPLAAEAGRRAAQHRRRGARRAGGPVLCGARLHAGPLRPDQGDRVPGHGRERRDLVDRLPAGLREVPEGQGGRGPEGARRVRPQPRLYLHARQGGDEARRPGRHQAAGRRRAGERPDQGARRQRGAAAAGADLRDPLHRRGGRRDVPARGDHRLQVGGPDQACHHHAGRLLPGQLPDHDEPRQVREPVAGGPEG